MLIILLPLCSPTTVHPTQAGITGRCYCVWLAFSFLKCKQKLNFRLQWPWFALAAVRWHPIYEYIHLRTFPGSWHGQVGRVWPQSPWSGPPAFPLDLMAVKSIWLFCYPSPTLTHLSDLCLNLIFSDFVTFWSDVLCNLLEEGVWEEGCWSDFSRWWIGWSSPLQGLWRDPAVSACHA